MRKLFQMQMPGVPQNIQAIFNEIFRASQEADVVDIGNAFSFDDPDLYVETRELNLTAPSAANIAAVLATLIKDMQRGGATKSN